MDASEYNRRRTKSQFFDWLNRWVQERITLSRIRERLRRNRESKQMHEEALPVYQYLRRFYPNREISIEMHGGDQPFDAIVINENGDVHEHLEVTCVPQANDHIARFELADTGQYSLKTRVTHYQSLASYAKLVSKGILNKLSKSYPSRTTLLVELASEMIIEDQDRFSSVIDKIDPKITTGAFSKIVIFDEIGTCFYTIHSKSQPA
jgi:hypothetical protein